METLKLCTSVTRIRFRQPELFGLVVRLSDAHKGMPRPTCLVLASSWHSYIIPMQCVKITIIILLGRLDTRLQEVNNSNNNNSNNNKCLQIYILAVIHLFRNSLCVLSIFVAFNFHFVKFIHHYIYISFCLRAFLSRKLIPVVLQK